MDTTAPLHNVNPGYISIIVFDNQQCPQHYINFQINFKKN